MKAPARLFVNFVAGFGLLRLLLFGLVAVAATLAPAPETRAVVAWPLIVPTIIAPAVAPLVFMAVMLDLLMARVMSAGETDAEKKARARRIMLADAVAGGVVAYAYLPFFLALGR